MADDGVEQEVEGMTAEAAARIRAWRVDADYTWRAVSEAAFEEWGIGEGIDQMYGRTLCETAARILGEDPDREPWN